MNPYRGEVSVEIGGAPRVLRYTWGAVIELRREFGTDFDAEISRAILELDLDRVSSALAIGLRHSWPTVTPREILDASPPIAVAVGALQQALSLAFNGPSEVSAKARQNPLQAAASRLRAILWKLRLSSPYLPA